MTNKNIPIYYFSKIKDYELRILVNIKQKLTTDIFDNWFNNEITLKDDEKLFLTELLTKRISFY
jgi:hypothetical protein